jgi:glutaredoxin
MSMPTTKSFSLNSTTILALVFALVFLVVGVWYYYGYGISGFGNTTNLKDAVNSLDIVMFTSPECKYCPQQLDAFKSQGLLNSIVVKDISDENNKKEAMRFGVIGFPYFISLKNRTATLGYEQDIQKIVDHLSPQKAVAAQKTDDSAAAQGPKVYVLTRAGCGWCDKAKKDIADKQVDSSVVAVVEAGGPDGKAVIDKYNIKVQGVPIFVNAKDGQTIVGFKPIEEVFKTFNIQ